MIELIRQTQPIWEPVSLALAHFLWQGMAIALALWVVLRLMNRFSPDARYAVCGLAMLLMAFGPIATLAYVRAQGTTFLVLNAPGATMPTAATEFDTPAASALAGTVHDVPMSSLPATVTLADTLSSDQDARSGSPWLAWGLFATTAAWLAGVAALALRLIVSWFGLHRLRQRDCEPLPEVLALLARRLREHLGLSERISVCASPHVEQPAAFGLYRPLVLLPASMVTGCPVELLEAVIAHELAHIRRYDLWVNVLQRVFEVVLFYHPAVWWVSGRMRAERELCCDDLAVQLTGRRDAYASALLELGRARLGMRSPVLATGMVGTQLTLTARVRRVLGLPPTKQESRRGSFWLAGPVSLLAAGALILVSALFPTNRQSPAVAQADSPAQDEAATEPAPSAMAVVDCDVERVVVSLDEVDGRTTLAASFMYGEYVEGAEDRMALLSSRTLGPEFEALPEAQRWLHPEYVVIRDFMARKEGDLEKLLTCYPEGPEKEKIRERGIADDKELIEQMNLREVLFHYKAYYGPYVAISIAYHEMPDDPSQKGRGIGGVIYQKRFNDRYLLVTEIEGMPAMPHPFVNVLMNYGGRKVLGRESITHDPDTSQMSWVAFDTNTQPSKGDETLRAVSHGPQPSPLQIPSSFSENHVVIYYRLQPVGVELKAGQHKPDLSPKLRFIESAVTASALGTEQEISKYWPEDSSYLRNIQLLKEADQWPEVRRSPWGDDPTILALLPTSGGTLVLFDKSSGNVWTLALIEAENDKDGPPWLLSEHLPMRSHLNSISHLFRNSSLMRDAFAEQYKADMGRNNSP